MLTPPGLKRDLVDAAFNGTRLSSGVYPAWPGCRGEAEGTKVHNVPALISIYHYKNSIRAKALRLCDFN